MGVDFAEDVDGEDAAPVIAVIAGCLLEPRVGAAVTAGARSKVVAAVQVLQALVLLPREQEQVQCS